MIISTAILSFLIGCKGVVQIDPEDIESLVVEPSEITLATRPELAVEQEFAAYAKLSDDELVRLDLISWESSNMSAGIIDDEGIFSSVQTNGGITDIVAKHFGKEGRARVTVVYTDDLVEEDVDQRVVNAFRNGNPTQSSDLDLTYPPNNVMVPRNLDGLGFAWEDSEASSESVYRVHLKSSITDISIYTSDSFWISNSQLWSLIAASNSGGSVEVSIEAGEWNGNGLQNLRASSPIDVEVNRFDARGSVYYWSSSNQGIMRIPIGTSEAEVFWDNSGTGGGCIGCHSVHNERMVVTHDGHDGRFTILGVNQVDLEPETGSFEPETTIEAEILVGPADQNRVTFKTLSPDGQYILGSNNNRLILFAMDTGVPIRTWQFDTRVAHPDWSPDGSQVVFTRVHGMARSDREFWGGSIVQMDIDIDNMELNDEVVLKEYDNQTSYYYPAYSPDGEWIVYVRSSNDQGISQKGASASAANPDDRRLWLMSREGTIDISLDTANKNTDGSSPDLLNSYPRWGPLPDDDVLWIAFSSVRPYPLAQAASEQIWVCGIDPAKAYQGEDPSTPAFWLPGQQQNTSNHLPVWSNR